MRRRDFLKTMLTTGAGTLLLEGTSTAGRSPLPLLVSDPELPRGREEWLASTCGECPAACGIRVRRVGGEWVRTVEDRQVRVRSPRAVKIEGNPLQPLSRGGLCPRGQAGLEGLYNPDRVNGPLRRDRPSGATTPIQWEEAVTVLTERLRTARGPRVAFLIGAASGSFRALVDDWLAVLGAPPSMAIELFELEALREANRVTFGRAEIPWYALEEAGFLLGLGADFLETWLSPVAQAQQFANMRRAEAGAAGGFAHVEPRLSLTAANADLWLAARPGTEGILALGIAQNLLTTGRSDVPAEQAARLTNFLAAYTLDNVAAATGLETARIAALAEYCANARPSLVLAGGAATATREATDSLVAANLLNYVAGNVGRTVRFGPSQRPERMSTYRDLLTLTDQMEGGEVDILFIHGVNPVFTFPDGERLAAAMANVPLVVSFASFGDETSRYADLVLPDHTPLEAWGDTTPRVGVHGLRQPIVEPLYDTRATGDVLLEVAHELRDEPPRSLRWFRFADYLKERWKTIHAEFGTTNDFKTFWQEAVDRGGVWRDVETETVELSDEVFQVDFAQPVFAGARTDSFFLLPYPSSRYYDGRDANRPWLQELADPITKVVWESWVEIHPTAAHRLDITHGDLVRVSTGRTTLELPAYLYDGIREDTVAIPIGQGHEDFGRYATGRGANPLRLLPDTPEARAGSLPLFSQKVSITPTGRRGGLVVTAGSASQLGRGIVQEIQADRLGDTAAPHDAAHELPDIYPPPEHPKHRWGMAIDLNSCIGCGACEVACVAENNIPILGEAQVARGREMAWLRIDRYFTPQGSGMRAQFLPMLCQQCGNAPCEPVCPVYATVHNSEGLNEQVHSRCIGTRYCSNNCPYKVRRFNWFEPQWDEPLTQQLNPDVPVRPVGVMEKCTFCIQRIRRGKDTAKDEERGVRDGDIVPACAQSCPTQAIVFGDLNDPESRVATLARDPRGYAVLGELNTQPAITYLRRIVRRIADA